MERIFLDTNVLLDWLGNRQPFGEAATRLFESAERKEIVLIVSPVSFIVCEYVLRKQLGKKDSLHALHVMRSLVYVADTGGIQIDVALNSGWNDLEDAFQEACARSSSATAIITRNVKDFSKSSLPIMSPVEYLSAR